MPRHIALVVLIGLGLVVESRQSDFVFTLPDLSVVQHSPGREFQLEAFRASQNDRILSGNISSSMRQLSWVSLGDPQLVTWTGSDNETHILQSKTDSIEVRTILLKDSMRELLAQAAREKHSVAVSPQQILTIPLSHVKCILPLEAEDGTRLALTGSATNLQENPLRISFDAPRSSWERAILEAKLRQAGSDEQAHLSIRCTFSALGKLLRVNTLTISVNQMHQLGIQEKLFGPAEERFVSRKQMVSLAADLYSRLDIVAEYEMPQHEFSESFIRDFIQQAAVQDFEQVSLHDALQALSQYAIPFGDDLKADEVVRDMGKVFRIDQVGDKSHIVVNTDKTNEGTQRNHTQGSSSSQREQESDRKTETESDNRDAGSQSASSSGSGSVSGGYLGYSAGGSYSQSSDSSSSHDRSSYNRDARSFYDMYNVANAVSFVADTSRHWLDASKSMNEQLRELNLHTRNDVEWSIEGRKVIPKKVNVARLSRSQFSKSLHFSRVRRDVVEAAFSKEFHFQTDSAQEPVHGVEYFVKNLANLERENTALKLTVERLEHALKQVDEAQKLGIGMLKHETKGLKHKVDALEQVDVTTGKEMCDLRGMQGNLTQAVTKQGQSLMAEITKKEQSLLAEMRRQVDSSQSSVLSTTKGEQQALRAELSRLEQSAQSGAQQMGATLKDNVAELYRRIAAASPNLRIECRGVSTGFTDKTNGEIGLLDRHNIDCSGSEFLQQFNLARQHIRGWSDDPVRYNYRCCRIVL